MTTTDLELTAQSIVADGKGILAADETPGTLTKRFTALGIESTPDSRRVLSQRAAFWVTDILSDDEARAYVFGRGGSLEFPFPVAGSPTAHIW